MDIEEVSSNCGYVAQDDLIHGTLTVAENIKFSSELRSIGVHDDHSIKTNGVIQKLGLTRCAGSIIGHTEWD